MDAPDVVSINAGAASEVAPLTGCAAGFCSSAICVFKPCWPAVCGPGSGGPPITICDEGAKDCGGAPAEGGAGSEFGACAIAGDCGGALFNCGAGGAACNDAAAISTVPPVDVHEDSTNANTNGEAHAIKREKRSGVAGFGLKRLPVPCFSAL